MHRCRLALNLLRQEEMAKVWVRANRLKAAWSTDSVAKILAHLAA